MNVPISERQNCEYTFFHEVPRVPPPKYTSVGLAGIFFTYRKFEIIVWYCDLQIVHFTGVQ